MKIQFFEQKNTLRGVIALIAWLVCTNGFAFEDDTGKNTRTLRNNPFIVPAYVNQKNAAAGLDAGQGDLKIRSVLLSKNNPLVNVNGKIMGLGDEIDGYKLTALDKDKAVFLKNGNEITVNVREQKNTESTQAYRRND